MCEIDKDFNLNVILGCNKLPNTNDLREKSDDQDQIFKKSKAFINKFLSDMHNEYYQNQDSTKFQKSVEHALRRSIRGVGSSFEMKMAENYFNLISILRLAPQLLINLDKIFNLMEAELSPITNTPRDQREVKTGQLFVMSAILCSGMHNAVPSFDNVAFIEKVMNLGQETTIFKGFAFKVLRQLILTAHENTFSDVILPYIIQEIQSERKSIFTNILLLLGEEKFPHICTPKVVKQVLGYKTVLNQKTIHDILNELKGKDGTKLFTFLYSDLCRNLMKPGADIENLKIFWEILGEAIDTKIRSVELVGIMFTTFNELVDHITDISQISLLLTQVFVTCLINPPKNKQFCAKRDGSLRKLYSALEKHKDMLKTTLLMSVIEKVLFCPGDFSFEESTSGKTFIRQTVSLMTKKGVKKLTALLRDVITNTSLKKDFKDGELIERCWHNREKVYAVHFLNRLLRHQSVYTSQKFKMEQLTFLTDIGFIVHTIEGAAIVGFELADTVRDSLYSAVTHKVPSLSDFQHMLITIIGHIDLHMNQGFKLRVKFTDDMKSVWQKMMASIKSLDEMNKKTKEELDSDQSVQSRVVVFQPMFLQLGLLLFKETKFAMDCLEELQEIYDRTMNNPDYEQWTGDIVELLLSLLSRTSQIHRNLIKCIFSHLCVYLTSENIISILRVLDPRADSNPLISYVDAMHENNEMETLSNNENESSTEEESSQDESDSDFTESSDNGEEEEDDSKMVNGRLKDAVGERESDDEETVNDRLRQAVRVALGEAGVNSDNESIDVEQMDVDEGEKVDAALGKAFATVRSIRSNKDKKQIAADRALTYFRLRVIDLLEVWLNTQFPKLDDLLDAMLTLLHLYGVCIMDRKQAPLVPRVRSCLKKLTSLKKVSDLEDVSEVKLAEILSLVIVEDNRSPTLYIELTRPIIDCALMILRFVKRFHRTISEETESSSVLRVIIEAMDKFFTQRNCPLQQSFFLNILKMEWICNWYLAEKLSRYAFGCNIRPFKRPQALNLLCTFFTNKRLVQNNINKVHKLKLKPIENLIYEKTTLIVAGKFYLQPTFMNSLLSLIKCIEQCKINDNKDWKELYEMLSDLIKINLKKKQNVENANDTSNANDEKTSDINNKKVFNLSITSGLANAKDCSGSSSADELIDSHRQKVNGILRSKNTSKDKTNSFSQQAESSVTEPIAILDKNKKRKKKHGKNKADKIISKTLRLEAGSQGLIDGCFSKLRLPTDVDGDDDHEEGNESNDDQSEEVDSDDNENIFLNNKEDILPSKHMEKVEVNKKKISKDEEDYLPPAKQRRSLKKLK